jgi:putative salt-induced outer membrane protein YdiY
VLALAYAEAALAQSQPAPPEPPPRFEGTAQFAFVATRGNAPAQSLGAGGEFAWRPDPWVHAGKFVFAQNESEDELKARSFAALFRTARKYSERTALYAQYDFLRDVFAGVEQRHVIEGGVSYLAIDRAPQQLRLDAGLGYLYEHRPEPDDHFDSATLSLGAGYKLDLSSTSQLTYGPRFLLTLADIDAWRFDQDAALSLAINTLLSLKVSHTLRYSAEPPEGFETTDTIMAVSLVAKMKRPR